MNKDNDLYKCVQYTFWNIKGDVASLKYVADRLQGDSKGLPPYRGYIDLDIPISQKRWKYTSRMTET